MFERLTETGLIPFPPQQLPHPLCFIGPQASAGNLGEAAGMMAQLVTQMNEDMTRACAILKLSRLRTSMLIRSPSAFRALKALPNRAARIPPFYVPSSDPKVTFSPFQIRRIALDEPRATTVLLLRDGLACCRRMSNRPAATGMHPLIAFSLVQLIVKSCDDGDAPCGSLAEAEGMLHEVLPLIEEDLWQLKVAILVDLAELLKKQGRLEEALGVMQEAQDLLQVHETAGSSGDGEEAGGEQASGEESSGEEASGEDMESSGEEPSGEDSRPTKRRRGD